MVILLGLVFAVAVLVAFAAPAWLIPALLGAVAALPALPFALMIAAAGRANNTVTLVIAPEFGSTEDHCYPTAA